MDRPTSRQGRHAGKATGSLSVADLVAKSTPAERASMSAIQAKAAEEAWAKVAAPPLNAQPGEPAGGDEASSASRLAKMIVATTLAMLAVGGVTTAAVLSDDGRQQVTPSVPTLAPGALVGSVVVRPNLLSHQLSGSVLEIGGSVEADPDAVLWPDANEEIHGPAMTLGGGESSGRYPHHIPIGYAYVHDTIGRFYRAAGQDPARAWDMLSEAMQGDGKGNFIADWQGVRRAPEIQQYQGGPNGVARLVVTIGWTDGTAMRVEQMLMVSERPSARIVRARLLSAHRI